MIDAMKLVTEPAQEPVSYADADGHLKTDGQEEAYVSALIATARRRVEHDTGLALITQTWRYSLEGFPCDDRIEIPKGPLQTVTSITYHDEDLSTSTVFSASNYQVDTDPTYGIIALKSTASWPTDTLRPSSGVGILFECGFGDDPADVPDDLRHAMLLLMGHLYEHRETEVVGTIVAELPTYDALIAPYRMIRF